MATIKRKSVSIMELVSNGSPQKLFAREGECHRISPVPKKYRELKRSQMGVRKSLVECSSSSLPEECNFRSNASNLLVVQGLIKTAVKQALQEEHQRQKEQNVILDDIVTGVTLRSLVSDWSRTGQGKLVLDKMTIAVNHLYKEATDLPYHRKVQHGDLLTEVKHLTKEAESKGAGASAASFLDTAKMAMEDVSGLSGSDFVALMSAYVHTNEQVHVAWNKEKLEHVVQQANHNELQISGYTPTSWIKKMAVDIAKEHGWSLGS